MKARRTIIALIASAVMVFSLSGMTGCSDNSEEVIRESLTEDFDQLKNMDPELVAQYATSFPESTMEQVGLTSDEVVKALLAGFDGTVDSVTVNGDTAEAVVTLKSKNFSDVESSMENLQAEMLDNLDQFSDMSTEEIKQWAGDKIMETIQGLPVVTHEPVTLEYELNGNTWEPAPGTEQKLQSALMG